MVHEKNNNTINMTTYIIDAIRTPIGNFGGTLKSIRTDDLGAIPIKELIKETKVNPNKIDDVILGCANQAGEDNRNISRMALLLAGLPFRFQVKQLIDCVHQVCQLSYMLIEL